MSVNVKGYLWFLCILLLTKKKVEFAENNSETLKYSQKLSQLLFDFLLLCLKDRRKASKTLTDLKKYEIKLSDIKKSNVKTFDKKERIVAIIFRHKILYKLACFVYGLKRNK